MRSLLVIVLATITLAASAARAQVGLCEPDGGTVSPTATRPHEHVSERRHGVGRELRLRALPELVTLTVDDRSARATLRLDW